MYKFENTFALFLCFRVFLISYPIFHANLYFAFEKAVTCVVFETCYSSFNVHLKMRAMGTVNINTLLARSG